MISSNHVPGTEAVLDIMCLSSALLPLPDPDTALMI